MRLPLLRATASVTLLAALALTTLSGASGLVISFTGNVSKDFPPSNPAVFIVTDNISITYNGNPAGWQMSDVRYAYDFASDTAYCGTILCV